MQWAKAVQRLGQFVLFGLRHGDGNRGIWEMALVHSSSEGRQSAAAFGVEGSAQGRKGSECLCMAGRYGRIAANVGGEEKDHVSATP